MIIKKPNNDHIASAVTILDGANDLVDVRLKTIDSTYKSYISSFGGSIIQSGLVGTLMTFEANDKKKKIITMLFALYNKNFPNDIINESEGAYFRTVLNITDKGTLRNRLIEMAVALKLAMRCFETKEETT